MRILLTVHQFFPEFQAGTEVLTLSVARELLKLGHQVKVFTGYPGEVYLSEKERFDEYVYEDLHIYRFHHAYVPMVGQYSKIEVGYNNALALSYFKKIVDDYEPDIIHYFHLNRLGIGLLNYAYDKKIPQFFTPTDFWAFCATAQLMLGEGKFCDGPDRYAGNCIKHFASDQVNGVASKLINLSPVSLFKQLSKVTKNQPLIKFPMSNEVRALSSRTENVLEALNKLQAIFAPNDFMRDLFLKYGVKKSLLKNQPFGIKLNKDNNIKSQVRKDTSHTVFGFIGTLASHKGCHVLIDAFNSLNAENVSLEIYGNPHDFPEYYDEIRRKCSGANIVFKGTFPNADITRILQRFDALIVPSIWYENTPLVIYSAQNAKVPVIGSKLPGIEAVIKPELNGLLFEAGNADDLAQKLNVFIVNKNNDFVYHFNEPLSIEGYVENLMMQWTECSTK